MCGGDLNHKTDLDVLREQGGSELIVALLNESGKVSRGRFELKVIILLNESDKVSRGHIKFKVIILLNESDKVI